MNTDYIFLVFLSVSVDQHHDFETSQHSRRNKLFEFPAFVFLNFSAVQTQTLSQLKSRYGKVPTSLGGCMAFTMHVLGSIH